MRHKPDLVDLRFDLYGSGLRHIAAGDSDILWVTCAAVGEVAALHSDGTVQRFPTDGAPDQIARGTTDIWFTMPAIDSVGRVDADRNIHSYKLPHGSAPTGLTTFGNDAWVTLRSTAELAKVSPDGKVAVLRPRVTGDSELGNPVEFGGARYIAADDRGSLWFTRSDLADIVRLDPDNTTESWTSPDCLVPQAITVDHEAVWIADNGIDGGLWRIGRQEKLLQRVEPWPTDEPGEVAADGRGGCWITEEHHDLVAHIDADAKLSEWDFLDYGEQPRGVAVDKNGVAWVAFRTGGVVGVVAPAPTTSEDDPDYRII